MSKEKDPIHVITEVCKDELPTSAMKKQHTEFKKPIQNISTLANKTLAKVPGLSAHEILDIQAFAPPKELKPAVVEKITPAPEPE